MPVEEAHGDEIDPHAWQSVPNAELYVKNIADALCAADPADCADYRGERRRLHAGARHDRATVRSVVAAIPPKIGER